eukprot:SAG11_NODE_1154_length_5662_cov_3.473665_1_plen_121_part_00
MFITVLGHIFKVVVVFVSEVLVSLFVIVNHVVWPLGHSNVDCSALFRSCLSRSMIVVPRLGRGMIVVPRLGRLSSLDCPSAIAVTFVSKYSYRLSNTSTRKLVLIPVRVHLLRLDLPRVN